MNEAQFSLFGAEIYSVNKLGEIVPRLPGGFPQWK